MNTLAPFTPLAYLTVILVWSCNNAPLVEDDGALEDAGTMASDTFEDTLEPLVDSDLSDSMETYEEDVDADQTVEEGDPDAEPIDDEIDDDPPEDSSVTLCDEIGGICLIRQDCPQGQHEHEEAVCMGPKTCCVVD